MNMLGTTLTGRELPFLDDPTEITLNADISIPLSARPLVRVADSGIGYTLTVPDKKSHWIVNSGNYTFTLRYRSGAGVYSTFDIDPSESFILSWDYGLSCHKVQTQQGTAVDGAMSASSANPVQNQVIKSYVDTQIAGAAGSVNVANVAALRALTTTPDLVLLRGHTTELDGGEGLFIRLASSGGNTADISSGGDDDNGWHIVCTTTGAVYGRHADEAHPEHFGAVGYSTNADAAAGSDQSVGVQRFVDFVLKPSLFNGWDYRGGYTSPTGRSDPRKFYRCDETILVDVPMGLGYFDERVRPGLLLEGPIWQPRTVVNKEAIIATFGRSGGKRRTELRAVRQLEADGKVTWNGDNWPNKWRDPSAYRQWSATTVFYAREHITHVLGSGATALYLVTVGGTSGGTGPSHTTGSAANGGITLSYLGTIANSDGRTYNEMLTRCRDIGISIQRCWDHLDLFVDAAHFTVGVDLTNRVNNSATGIGFNRIRFGTLTGCKFGILVGEWWADKEVANSTERLALTDLPIGFVARQTNDAVNDYRFIGFPAGTLGTESNAAAWATEAQASSPHWVNENYFSGNLIYGRGDGTLIDSDQTVYGFTSTRYGERYAPGSMPDHQTFDSMTVEFSDQVEPGESVHYLLDYALGCDLKCRVDTPTKNSPAVFVPHADVNDESAFNTVKVYRGARHQYTETQAKDVHNGQKNRVEEYVGPSVAPKEYIVEDLNTEATCSGIDRVFFSRLTSYQSAATTFREFGAYGSSVSFYKLNPDGSWRITYHEAPGVIVSIPNNYRGDAQIEVEAFGENASNVRWDFSIYDPISGLITDYSSRARTPIGGEQLLQWNVGSALKRLEFQSYDARPRFFGLEPWIDKVLVRVTGDNLRGFRVALHNSERGAVYSEVERLHRIPRHMVEAPPERGFFRAPCRVFAANQTGVDKGWYLNKPIGSTNYVATSGTQISLAGSEVGNQWAHDGAGNVAEWNGASWDTIITGATVVEPSDWTAFA